jgi:hypothetical protein
MGRKKGKGEADGKAGETEGRGREGYRNTTAGLKEGREKGHGMIF